MSDHLPTPPDRVHAFVDAQLDSADRARLLAAMEEDPELRRQVCDLRQLKDMVSLAYEHPPAATGAARVPSGRATNLLRLGALAMVLFVLGFVTGRFSDGALVPKELVLAQPYHPTQRVLLHLVESDPSKFAEALDRAEVLMSRFQEEVEVEVITQAGGLDLLRADVSPFTERVQDMLADHPNLHVVACEISLTRLRQQGVPATLVERTELSPSALEHIVERVQEGWTYIKV